MGYRQKSLVTGADCGTLGTVMGMGTGTETWGRHETILPSMNEQFHLYKRFQHFVKGNVT